MQLLKEHLIEQVNKFKKYDSVEATESGRERLNSEWGSKMRVLMTVWPNYEQLLESDAASKLNQSGRLQKIASKRKQTDTEIAKKIRDAALGIIEDGNSDIYSGNYVDIPLNETSEDTTLFAPTTNMQLSHINSTELNSPHEIEESEQDIERSSSSESTFTRKHTKPATKNRNKQAKDVWQYLAEKSCRESETQLLIHKDNIEIKHADLKYKQDKLEFEKEKWKVEVEERKMMIK